jgi:hypothetical protein
MWQLENWQTCDAGEDLTCLAIIGPYRLRWALSILLRQQRLLIDKLAIIVISTDHPCRLCRLSCRCIALWATLAEREGGAKLQVTA